MKHFRVTLDGSDHEQWLLGPLVADGASLDSSIFDQGHEVDARGAMTASTARPGQRRGLSWTADMVPLVSEEAAAVIESVTPGAVQWFAVDVDGTEMRLANILHAVACLDEERTKMWKKDAPDAPEYSSVFGVAVRDDVATDDHLYRVAGWRWAIIVTAQLKEALDAHGFRGWQYLPA